MGFNLKGVLGTVAPWIATAIGGPMAGQAVSMISGALGLKSDAKLGDVQEALAQGQLTGDQLVALKKADQEFQEQMQAAGFKHIEDLEALAASDRASARAREIAVKDWTPKVLAIGVTIGFFGLLAFLTFKDVPAMSHDILIAMVGSLGAAWASIVSYYFGSSAGSAAKTDILAQQATGKVNDVTPSK